MAIYPGTEPVLEAAAHWKERCLVEDGSILTDDSLWTLAHFDELQEQFVEDPKLGSEKFLEKMEQQMEEASPGATKLMAELLWVLMLFPLPKNFSHDTKRRKIRTVWEWSREELPESPYLEMPLERGIGSVGPGFINHQAFELMYLIAVARDLKRMDPGEREARLDDPWRLVSWLDSYENLGIRQLCHILSHLLHPEIFERISSGLQKGRILAGFGRTEVTESDRVEDMDRALLELRRELEEEYPDRDDLDFFRPPLIERWKPAEPPEFEIVEEAMQRACEAFRRWHGDFKSFEKPGKSYVHRERGYKSVLRQRFHELLDDLPDVKDVTEERGREVADRVVTLLTKQLDPYDWPQNLLNWRYWTFLKELKEGEASLFTRALIELLDEEISLPARVERFNEDIWPVLENHDAASHAISRSLPTLFLWLHEPDEAIYVRTDLFNSMGRRLTGDKIFLNKRMDMEEYRKALAFAKAVRQRLDGRGWKPKDMIDVQSFLWVADRSLEEIEDGKNGDNGSGGRTIELQEVVDALEAEGFHFPQELVANYILALQTKRFVILTGISGTGKTQLAIQVAELFTAEEDPETADGAPGKRVRVVAVRPDWTDPRGLIGYYNPIMERYVVTDFLRLLLAAREEEARARKEDRAPRPYFVVLDEMNLARVEHYFSDFLSALESGRALSLHHERAKKDGDENSGPPPELRVPRNVFFTGTVNVDETTHMFSPKVLDRAFTLELNEVDLDGWALGDTDRPGAGGALDLPELEGRLRWHGQPGAEEWRKFGELLDGKLRETVTGLNAALSPWGYHFGYRVAGEIAAFVLLAHRQGANSEEALWSALDLALLEKVFPKFHGTEQELEAALRTAAFVAAKGHAPTGDEADGLEAENPSPDDDRVRLPHCHEKVRRMLRRLRQTGFAAFIE